MASDENYTPVSLFAIPPDEPLPFSISVYYKGHFVPYRKAGEVFEVGKYNRFIYKRISKLYIKESELESYRAYVRRREQAEEERFSDPKLSVEQKVAARAIHKIEVVTQELFIADDEDIGATTTRVVEVARDTVQRICERPYLRIFDSIPNSSSVVTHSMRVSLLATYVGYQLGFVNPLALENLAAAGMLHDIGKTRVALPDGIDEISEEQETELLRKHPLLSVEALRKTPLVPEEVLTIINEHHENRDGSGYPSGTRGRQLHGLTKVFSIVNTFDNLTAQLTGDREARGKLAAEKMEKEMRAWFDPMLLPKALRLLSGAG